MVQGQVGAGGVDTQLPVLSTHPCDGPHHLHSTYPTVNPVNHPSTTPLPHLPMAFFIRPGMCLGVV
eukprot:765515-Hanusia_phi.AAC.1